MTLYHDHTGKPVTADVQLGAGGGGKVFSVREDPTLAVKIFHVPTPEMSAKMGLMVSRSHQNIFTKDGHPSIAWPIALIIASDKRTVLGYTMPKVDFSVARELITVVSPQERELAADSAAVGSDGEWLRAFTWRHLLRVARNLAGFLSTIHADGYVAGDINDSNILVRSTAQITVLDCDSFQVTDTNGVTYYSGLKREEYSAPELIGVDVRTLARRADQDNFALAIFMCKMLLEGEHPYSGIWKGPGQKQTLEARIRDGNCPFVPGMQSLIEPRKTGLSFVMLPPAVQRLMVRCFGDGHGNPAARPSALEWWEVLRRTERQLVTCPANGQHVYSRQLSGCPWCLRVAAGYPDSFPPPPGPAQQVPLPTPTWPSIPPIIAAAPSPAAVVPPVLVAPTLQHPTVVPSPPPAIPAAVPQPAPQSLRAVLRQAAVASSAPPQQLPTPAAPPLSPGQQSAQRARQLAAQVRAKGATTTNSVPQLSAIPFAPVASPPPPQPPKPKPVAAPAQQATLTCSNCGVQQRRPGVVFCHNCDWPQQGIIACPRCRKPRPSNARFCPQCGK